MDGGLGDDRFQFGQIFGSEPIAGGTYDDGNGIVSNGIAAGDDIATIQTTRGYLSNGASFAVTAFGGEGADRFTVYANRGEVRLEGATVDGQLTLAWAHVDAGGGALAAAGGDPLSGLFEAHELFLWWRLRPARRPF